MANSLQPLGLMGKAKEKTERAQRIFQSLLSPTPISSNEKKRKIVEATIHILASEGVEKVTFESVGLKLDTTKANIRYHFSSKEDLIFTAVKFMAMTAQQITKEKLDKATTSAQRVDAVVEGAFQHLRDHPDHLRVFMMYFYYSSFQYDYQQFYMSARSVGQERLSVILSDLPLKKNIQTEKNHLLLAEEIQNIITGQLLGVVLLNRPWAQSLSRTKKIISALLASEGIQWVST